MRHFFALSCLMLLASPALAGFEWIPPAQQPKTAGDTIARQTADAALTPNWQAEAQGYNPALSQAPAPVVEAMPLLNDTPTSLFPASQQEVLAAQQAAPAPKQNLSGKALVINPYPLRKGAIAPPMQGVETYKAMKEEAKMLHPVNLGSGHSTGSRPKAIPFPQPFREASVKKRTYNTPDINHGMTPMTGGDNAPLPRVVNTPVQAAKNDNRQYAQAIGFGQDLPLALALSQVVPSDFSHSFAKDVDAGMTVSWEGGKAWNLVLNDMLRPKNLTAVIQDNQVIIQPMASL